MWRRCGCTGCFCAALPFINDPNYLSFSSCHSTITYDEPVVDIVFPARCLVIILENHGTRHHRLTAIAWQIVPLVELEAVLEKQTITWLSWSSALKPRSPLCCFSLRPAQLSIYAWKPEAASFSAAASSLIKHEHWWRQRPALRWVSLLSRSWPLHYRQYRRAIVVAREHQNTHTHTRTGTRVFKAYKWFIVPLRWVNTVRACLHMFMVIHPFI